MPILIHLSAQVATGESERDILPSLSLSLSLSLSQYFVLLFICKLDTNITAK